MCIVSWHISSNTAAPSVDWWHDNVHMPMGCHSE